MALLSTTFLLGLSLAGMLSSGPLPQEGPSQAPTPASPPTIEDYYGTWMPLDQVVIVVNGDIITQRKIRRKIDEALAKQPNTTAEEFRGLVARVQEEEVESLLIRQAGEDLGLPPDAVKAHVSGTLRDESDEAGGAFAMARKLRDDDTTALELAEDRTTEIYESSWRRKIAGMSSGQERSSEDRYIRPGNLTQRYRRIQRTGRDIGFLVYAGAQPAGFKFQVLLITPKGAGSMKEAQAKAEQAHEALIAGDAEWEDLVATLGELGNEGLTPPFNREQVQQILDPGTGRVMEFAMGAEPDSISAVMQFPEVNPATGERRLDGYAIYKLLERSPAFVPEFSAAGVQRDLRRAIQGESDETRWQDALGELKRTAYIWHPDIEAQRAERKAARARRDEEIQKARDENAARFRAAEKAAAGKSPQL